MRGEKMDKTCFAKFRKIVVLIEWRGLSSQNFVF